MKNLASVETVMGINMSVLNVVNNRHRNVFVCFDIGTNSTLKEENYFNMKLLE